jgi:hypothetical protein
MKYKGAAPSLANMQSLLPSGTLLHYAQAGLRFWQRHKDETFEQFELRVLKDLVADKRNANLPSFY